MAVAVIYTYIGDTKDVKGVPLEDFGRRGDVDLVGDESENDPANENTN